MSQEKLDAVVGRGARRMIDDMYAGRAETMSPEALAAWRSEAGSALALLGKDRKLRADAARLAVLARDMVDYGQVPGLPLSERLSLAASALSRAASFGTLNDASRGVLPSAPATEYDAPATAALYYALLAHPSLTRLQSILGVSSRLDRGVAATVAFSLAGVDGKDAGQVADFAALIDEMSQGSADRGRAKYAVESLRVEDLDGLSGKLAELMPEGEVRSEFLSDSEKADLVSDPVLQAHLDFAFGPSSVSVMLALASEAGESSVNLAGNDPGSLLDPFENEADYRALARAGRAAEPGQRTVKVLASGKHEIEVPTELAVLVDALFRSGMSHGEYRRYSRRVLGTQNNVENFVAAVGVSSGGVRVSLKPQRRASRASRAAAALALNLRNSGLQEAIGSTDFGSLRALRDSLNRKGLGGPAKDSADKYSLGRGPEAPAPAAEFDAEANRDALSELLLGVMEVYAKAAEMNGSPGVAAAIRTLARRSAAESPADSLAAQARMASRLEAAVTKAREGGADLAAQAAAFARAQFGKASGELVEKDRDAVRERYGYVPKGAQVAPVLLDFVFRDAGQSSVRSDGSQHRTLQIPPRIVPLLRSKFPGLLASKNLRAGQLPLAKIDEAKYGERTVVVADMEASARARLAVALARQAKPEAGEVLVPVNPGVRGSLYLVRFDAKELGKLAAGLPDRYPGTPDALASALRDGKPEGLFVAAQWAMVAAQFGEDRAADMLSSNELTKRLGLVNGTVQAVAAPGAPLKGLVVDRIEIDGEVLPKAASDGFQFALAAHVAEQLGDAGGAFKITMAGHESGGPAGAQITAAKPAGIPESVADEQAKAEAFLGGEIPGDLAIGFLSVEAEMKRAAAEAAPGYDGFIVDAGAVKDRAAELTLDGGSGPVTLRFRVGGHDVVVSAQRAWAAPQNVAKVSEVADEADRGSTAFGVSAAINLAPYAPDSVARVWDMLSLGYENLASMPEDARAALLDEYIRESVAQSTPAAQYAVETVGYAVDNFMVRPEFAAASMLRESGRPVVGYLYNLVAPSMQTLRAATSAENEYVFAAKNGKPAGIRINDSREDAAYSVWTTDEFDADFRSEADRVAAFRRLFETIRELRESSPTAAEIKSLPEEALSGMYRRREAAVAALEGMRKYFRDFTQRQELTFLEDVSGFFGADGKFRERLVESRIGMDGKLRTTAAPQPGMFERFPGSTGMTSRDAPVAMAPATLAVREIAVLGKDGRTKRVRRVASGTANLVVMDVASLRNRGIDNDADKHRMSFASRPRGAAPNMADVRARAKAGKLDRNDLKWLGYWIASEFVEALSGKPDYVANASLDPSYGNGAELSVPAWLRETAPAIADAEKAVGRDMLSAKLHPLAALSFPSWEARLLAAAEASDRGHVVQANDGLAIVAGLGLDLSAEAGKFGDALVRREVAPGLFLGVSGSRWRDRGELLQRVFDLGNNQVNSIIDAEKNWTEYLRGVMSDTSPMKYALIASWVPGFTAEQEAQKREEFRVAAKTEEEGRAAFDAWARATPGTMLHFEQSWVNFVETDPGMRLFLDTARSLKEGGERSLYSWDQWVDAMSARKADELNAARAEGEPAVNRRDPKLREAVAAATTAVEAIYRVGDQIKRLGGIAKQYHNLGKSAVDALRMRTDLEAIEKGGAKLSDEDRGRRLPLFPNVDVGGLRSSPAFALQRRASDAMHQTLVRHSPVRHPAVVSAMQRAIDRKNVPGAYRIARGVEKSLARSAAIAAFPELAALLNDSILPYYSANAGVPEIFRVLMGAETEARIAAILGLPAVFKQQATEAFAAAGVPNPSKEKLDEKVKELSAAYEREMEMADSAAPAFALEQVAVQLVVELLNGKRMSSSHPELVEELAGLLEVQASSFPTADASPLEAARATGQKLRFRTAVSDSALDLDAWQTAVSKVEQALRDLGGLPVVVKTMPIPASLHKIKTAVNPLVQSDRSSLAKSLLERPTDQTPEALAAWEAKKKAHAEAVRRGEFTPVDDRVMREPLSLTITADMVRPLLAYYGASAFESRVGRSSGNPLASADQATLRRYAEAFRAVAAVEFRDDRAAEAIKLVAEVAGKTVRGPENEAGYARAVPQDLAPVVMVGVSRADKAGKPFSGRVDVSPFVTASLLDAMSKQNFRETRHRKDGKLVARPYPDDRVWDGIRGALGRADDLAGIGVFHDRLVESAVQELLRVGRPGYAAAVRTEYAGMKANAKSIRPPANTPESRRALESMHPESVVELERRLRAGPKTAESEAQLERIAEVRADRNWKARLAAVRDGKEDLFSARWLDEATRIEAELRAARPDISDWESAGPIVAVAGWASAREADAKDPNPLLREDIAATAKKLAVSAALGDFGTAYRDLDRERGLPVSVVAGFRTALARASVERRAADDGEAGRVSGSLVSYWELSAMYAAQRAAIGGIDYLRGEINRVLNMQDAWERRLDVVIRTLGRVFADYPTRRTVTRRVLNKKDSAKAGFPVYDYADGVFNRAGANVHRLTDIELNEQGLMDYLVAAIRQGSKYLTFGTDEYRGVVMEAGPDGTERPAATVWVLDGKLVAEGTPKAKEIRQVDGWDEATHRPTSAFMTIDFAIEKLMGSDYYKTLLEYGRELSSIDIRRNADGSLSGGLVDYANAIGKELRDALHDYRELDSWTGRAAEEGLVGEIENYLPQVFGGHGFEDAPRRRAREEVHRQSRRKGWKGAGAGSLLPAAAFQAKFHDVGDSRKPLAEQEALYAKLSAELDSLYLARRRKAPKLADATRKDRESWDRIQYNHALLRLAERTETEKAVAVGADSYQMEPQTAELIRGLKTSIGEYAAKEWSARRGKREYATYYEAFVESSNDPAKPAPLMAAITDPLRLAESSIRDLMDTLAREVLVNQFMLAADSGGDPLVLAIPREGVKDPNPANRGRDIRSMLREDTLRKQLRMLEEKAGRPGKGETVYDRIRDLLEQPNPAIDLKRYVEVKSDYASVDKFYVLRDEKGATTHARYWFEHVVGRPAEWKVKLGGEYEHDLLGIASKVNQFMKHMSVGWSLFFATSGIESVVAATPLNRNNMANFLHPQFYRNWSSVRELGRRVRRGDMQLAMDLYKYHKAGIMISERNISDGSSSVVDEVIERTARAFGDRYSDPKQRAAREQGARTVLRTLAGRKMSEWLMGDFFGGLKLWSTQFLVDEFQKKNPHLSEESVLEIVAPIVNDAFGGQNWHRYWWATPKIQQLLNLLMFAPNWSLSAANVGGLGLITGPALGNYMSPEQAAFVARNWAVMYLVALQLVPNLLQAVIYGLGHALPGDPDDEKEEKEDRLLAWSNEQDKGQFFPSIDITPLMRKVPGYEGDPTGRRRVYVRFGKQSYEVLQGWLKDPMRTAGSKTSMLVKAAWEQLTGYAPGSPDFALPFRSAGAVLGLVDSDIGFRGSRIGTLLSKALPMTLSSALSNPDAFLTSIFVPASKGMSQTKAVQGMIALLEGYSESGPAGIYRRHPDQRASMDALAARYVEALRRNGYDPRQVVTAAKGKVLPTMYADFYDAFVEKDEAKMVDAARRIYRIAGTSAGLLRSVESRQTKTGRPALTEAEIEAVKEAFVDGMPSFVAAAVSGE